VRVKAGVFDPVYPDIPLGAWTGVITDIKPRSVPPTYEVTWNEETLAKAHPIYFRRCDRDDLEPEATWLRENDLEPDPGGEPVLEQPTLLIPRPLDPNRPEDITQGIFGLTSDDDPPPINEENMRRFHEYLSERLRFPFPALCIPPLQGLAQPKVDLVIVERLIPLEELDLEEGLMAEVSSDNQRRTVPLLHIQVAPDEQGARDLQAYLLWAINEPRLTRSEPPFTPRTLALVIVTAWAALGAIIGSLLETVPEGWVAAQVGGVIFALLGAVFGVFLEQGFREEMDLPSGKVSGMVFGLIFGAVCGAAAGAMVVAWPGTIPGAIAGFLLAKVLAGLTSLRPRAITFALVGAVLGALARAYRLQPDEALAGAGWGALIGVGSGVVFLIAVLIALSLIMPRGKTE
jgi:hypothetical protein